MVKPKKMVPIVFAAFANDLSNPLNNLIKERDALHQIFDDGSKAELLILENATFDYINETIINKRIWERIVIFHYAGHANGKIIELTDGPVRAVGLAKLLKSLSNLQLIFLNGCETSEQVVAIQKENVKAAVITTLRPVNDEVATNFARYFYYAFYKFNTLNDSFKSAETRTVAKNELEKHFFLTLYRSIGREDVEIIGNILQNNKTVYVITSVDKDFLSNTFLFNINYTPTTPSKYDYEPNRLLIESLSNSIMKGTYINGVLKEISLFKNFEYSYENYNNEVNNRNFGFLVKDVLALLPFPLSFHINILKSNANNWDGLNNEEKKMLLKQQITTYNSLIQLLCFTLLSSLWSELEDRKPMIVPISKLKDAKKELSSKGQEKSKTMLVSTSQWEIIKNFLSSNELNNQEINYPALLVAIREIFDENELDPFISEYQQLRNIFETEDDFYATHLQIQGLKSSISNEEIKKMNIDWLCFEMEKKLEAILSKSGFVIKYKLTTVKNIEMSKSRLKGPSYHIQRIILDGATVEEDDIVVYPTYTDSRSVILAKGVSPETFTRFLSLSPFIIDENALKGENLSKLYFYSHSIGEGYVYRWAENPENKLTIKKQTYPTSGKRKDPMEIVNKRMESIKEELDLFKTLFQPNIGL